MKLPLELIKENINSIPNPLFFREKSGFLFFSRPILYSGQQILKSNSLFLIHSDQLPKDIRCEKEVGLILIGDAPKKLQEKADAFLQFDSSVNFNQLSNELNRIFDLFDNWEKELLSLSYGRQFRPMLQKMMETSSDIIHNGIAIMNNAFHIVLADETTARFGGYPPVIDSRSMFPVPSDTVTGFKFDKEYLNITNERGVFYYSGDMLPHRVLCKNIFQHDQFLFRIILTECIRPFRKSDEFLLDFLADHFERALTQIQLSNTSTDNGLPTLLSEGIESGKINRLAIEKELAKLNWSYTDIYRIAIIRISSEDLYISSLHYFALFFMQSFPGTFAFEYQNTILVLANETKKGLLTAYSDQLSILVRENNFRVGISNFAKDISNIQILYRQAEIALSIGLAEKPMEWIHWFSRYTLHYIYNMLTYNTDMGQLYSPIYYRLERYDAENNTSYLETLRVYLEQNQNTVQAAKALFIQRSTMIYRLKRIREIANNNLEDPDDLLLLYLTFSMIRFFSRKTD